MRKGINISHVNIENMGGRDQSQVKNKSLKSSKKVSPFQKTYQKVITMTYMCTGENTVGNNGGSKISTPI